MVIARFSAIVSLFLARAGHSPSPGTPRARESAEKRLTRQLEHSKNMLMNANRLAIVGASKNSTMNNATAKSARRGGIS